MSREKAHTVSTDAVFKGYFKGYYESLDTKLTNMEGQLFIVP
jgi:hypothetical protein